MVSKVPSTALFDAQTVHVSRWLRYVLEGFGVMVLVIVVLLWSIIGNTSVVVGSSVCVGMLWLVPDGALDVGP